MLTLIASAWASACDPGPPVTEARQRVLAPDEPLVVTASWGDGAHLARRIRVRDPAGSLIAVRAEVLGPDARLIPREAWPHGSVQIEERGDHDADGRRVVSTWEPAGRSGWFPVDTIEVRGPSPALSAPGEISWSRATRDGVSRVVATVDALPSEVRWLALELDGVGPIAHEPARGAGVVVLSDLSGSRCGRPDQLLPVDGDLTARVVLHGDGGARWEGPWTVLGPALPFGWVADGRGHNRMVEGVAEPIGVPTDVRALRSWTPVEVSVDDRPLEPDPGGCGSLELVSARREEVPFGSTLLADDQGRIRQLLRTSEGMLLDGQLLPAEDARVVGVVTRGPTTWVALEGDPSSVVAVRDGARVARIALAGRPEALEGRPDGTIVVRTRDAAGVRTRHELSPALAPLSQAPVLSPIEVERGAVNGVPVPGRGRVRGSSAFVGPEHALIVENLDRLNTQRLQLVGADGTVVWTREVEAERVPRAVVDDRGVAVELVRLSPFDPPVGAPWVRETVVVGWDVAGAPRSNLPARGWGRPDDSGRAAAIPWGERQVFETRNGLVVEEDGVRSPPWGVRGEVVVPDGDTLRVAWTEMSDDPDDPDDTLHEQTLRCAGRRVGVPDTLR